MNLAPATLAPAISVAIISYDVTRTTRSWRGEYDVTVLVLRSTARKGQECRHTALGQNEDIASANNGIVWRQIRAISFSYHIMSDSTFVNKSTR